MSSEIQPSEIQPGNPNAAFGIGDAVVLVRGDERCVAQVMDFAAGPDAYAAVVVERAGHRATFSGRDGSRLSDDDLDELTGYRLEGAVVDWGGS